MGEDPEGIRAEIAATRDQMGETADAIAYRANVPARTKDRISSTVESVRSGLGVGAARISSAAPSGTDVREGTKRAAGIAQENPLGLALGAAALGFLAGLALPATQVENERIGAIADDVKQQALQTGQEALGHAQDVAHDAIAGAVGAAQESGQEHLDQLKESAQEHLEHINAAGSPD